MPTTPVDPAVDLHAVTRRRVTLDLPVVGAIALGGVLGAEARYLWAQAWP